MFSIYLQRTDIDACCVCAWCLLSVVNQTFVVFLCFITLLNVVESEVGRRLRWSNCSVNIDFYVLYFIRNGFLTSCIG